jgi:hypothetical protein
VFDIGTAISGITADDWEYSTGGPGWANLAAEQDNTANDGGGGGSAFDTTGVGSVHWRQPSAWATQAENGITGYWIRVLVTAIPGPHVAPTQQNRDVYSIVWPYVDIDELQVGGGVTLLARNRVHNASDHFNTGTAPKLWANRIIMGLRSLSRGSDFTAYLNFTDTQNPTGIATSITDAAAVTSLVNDVTTPTGRRILFNPAGVLAMGSRCVIALTGNIPDDYRGKYHVFIRGYQTAGATGDIKIRIRYVIGADAIGITLVGVEQISDTLSFQNPGTDWELLDFGQVTIPLSEAVLSVNNFRFEIEMESTSGAPPDAYLYDLIVMPIDEWSGDYVDPTPGYANSTSVGRVGAATSTTRSLDADALIFPKKRRALVRRDDQDDVVSIYQAIAVTGPILQANRDQRLWFLSTRADSGPVWTTEPEIGSSVQIEATKRYYSMRGSR